MTIIFFHIPKSGGTSLGRFLQSQYEQDDILTIHKQNGTSLEEFQEFDEAKRNSYRLIKGHRTFGLHQHISHQVSYFSMIRNPVDRCLSAYYFVKEQRNHWLHEEYASSDDIRDFMDKSYDDKGQLFNTQTRIFALVGIKKANLFSEDELLGRAIKNIDKHFSFIGLTERYEESLQSLCELYGWKYYIDRKKHNKTKSRPQINHLERSTIEKLEEKNRLDIELYNYVEKKFFKP